MKDHHQQDAKSSRLDEEEESSDPRPADMSKQRQQTRSSSGSTTTTTTTTTGSSYRQLVESCKRKDLARIKSILAQRPKLANHVDKQSRSLLHYAAILMLDETQPLSAMTNFGPHHQRQMSRAELEQCIECFDFLADRCDIKLWWQQDADGLSVLHMAVISSNVPLVEHIIYEHPYAIKYPLVGTKDREHHSPLHWAVITNNLESVKLLVNYGGTKLAHEPDLNGATPLHYATQTSDYPRYRQQLRSMLRNVGAGAGAGSGSRSDGEQVAEQAIGSTSTTVEAAQQPPSGAAAQQQRPASGGQEAGMAGASQLYRSLEILEYLVRLPMIDLECADRDRRTPLLWAASSGNRDAIELLLAHGAQARSCDINRLGALHCAASHGFTACLESIFACAGSGKQQVDPNQVDNLNCTPLFYSVLSGNVDCVETLLERGARCDWQDSKGRTAAHFAALKGQLGALKLLQERGANLWLANKQGDLPLHYAIKSGRLQVVRWLLERSPYERAVNAINNFGRAPIHLAVMRNNTQMVEYLVRCGANLNQLVKTKSKLAKGSSKQVVVEQPAGSGKAPAQYHYETALDMAKNLGNTDCLHLLEQHRALPAGQVITSRQALLKTGGGGGDYTSATKSLFDIQTVEGPSPIGFETSCSSASPNVAMSNGATATGSSEAPPTTSEPLARIPKLRRPVPDSLPGTDSTGSSALSQNSLTSVRGGGGGQNPPLGLARKATEARAGQSEEGLAGGAAANDEATDCCDNCAKSQATDRQSSTRPYRGGISYNNEHICASIKCKLYDKPKPCGCGSQSATAATCKAPPGEQTQTLTHSAPVKWRSGAGQEIVTNVNVYTSPCAHCMHQSACQQVRKRKCNECRKWADSETANRAMDQQRQQRDVTCSADETTDAQTGSDDDDEEEEELGEADGEEEEEELELEGGQKLPSLMGPSSTSHQGPTVSRLRHLPPSQGLEQHLPVILSDREQSTSATSNELEPDEEAPQDQQQRKPQSVDDEGQVVGGQDGYQKVPPPKRTLVSPAHEEPRFDRSPQATRGLPPRTERHTTGKMVRSPVAEYIRGPMAPLPPEPVRSTRTRPHHHRASHPQQQTPDFSHVKPRVDSHRLPVSGHHQDEPSRSKSMSVLSHETSPHLSGMLRASPAAGHGSELGGGGGSRSVSRQTVIRTRRLSVDSVELATRVEKAIRKYRQETKLFEELQNLKRSQIRSGRANEALLVKRLVEHLRQDTRDLIGLDTYQGPYTYKSYERFLYDQLRKLSQSNCAKLSRHQPPYRHESDEHEHEYEQGQQHDDQHELMLDSHYLDEDLRAELELRRIIGPAEQLVDGEQHQKREQVADDSDLESYVLEPSGALEEIRVRGDAGRSNLDEAEGAKATNQQAEKLVVVHQESLNDDLAESDQANKQPPPPDDRVEGEPMSRKASLSSLTSEPSGGDEGEKLERDLEKDVSDMDEEAKNMSSAIITDALGNVTWAGSQPDITRLDGNNKESVAKGDELKDDNESQHNLDIGGSEGSAEVGPARGRRKSLVNIGNKMELVYHDVGIEINPAPDTDEDADGEDTKTEVQRDDEGDVEEKSPRSDTESGESRDQQSSSTTMDRLTDVMEEEEQVAGDSSSGPGSGKQEKLEAARPEAESLSESSDEAGEGRLSGSDYSAPVTVVAASSRSGSVSRSGSKADPAKPISADSGCPRRASSPSTCRATDSTSRKCRRDPTRWSGGSSFSAADTATPGAAVQPTTTKTRIFNGHDLDEMHRERSRSRGSQRRQPSQEDRPPQAEAHKEGVSGGGGGKGSSAGQGASEMVDVGVGQEDGQLQVEDPQREGQLSGQAKRRNGPGRRSSSSKRRRLVRSHIPATKYVPSVHMDEIRDRWSRIKSAERAKLEHGKHSGVEFIGNRLAPDASRGKRIAAAKSQPNLKDCLQSSMDKGSEENEDDANRSYTLLYEINEARRGWFAGAGAGAGPAGDGAGPARSAQQVARRKPRGKLWCQRMAAQIVDVRTIKRTLSLPETVMYSNNLLKRFNILKL